MWEGCCSEHSHNRAGGVIKPILLSRSLLLLFPLLAAPLCTSAAVKLSLSVAYWWPIVWSVGERHACHRQRVWHKAARLRAQHSCISPQPNPSAHFEMKEDVNSAWRKPCIVNKAGNHWGLPGLARRKTKGHIRFSGWMLKQVWELVCAAVFVFWQPVGMKVFPYRLKTSIFSISCCWLGCHLLYISFFSCCLTS